MAQSIELPLWLIVILVATTFVSVLNSVLLPSVRWFFRKRLERAVMRLNARLERPIQPFKLARRHDMIQRLVYDTQVHSAIIAHASAEGVPEEVAFETARRYAREIVPAFSAAAYFGFAIRISRWLATSLFRVRVGYQDEPALAGIDPDATVIFVMNHRSNMDYVLVTYLVADRSALSYAVGEWARTWPLRALIRSMGAYFIRRKSRNLLYRKVLARYVQMATAGGVAQAIFPEGGLTLDGHIAPPKLGLLSYVVEGVDLEARDVVFVPVALSYDRVLEDRILMAAGAMGERRFKAKISNVVRYLGRQIWNKIRGRFYRYGYAAVSFGTPLSLRHTPMHPEALGIELMTRVAAVMPVLPVPMVAYLLLESSMNKGPEPVAQPQLKAAAHALIQRIELAGGYVHLAREDLDYTLAFGTRILLSRRIAVQTPDGLCLAPGQHAVASYYAAGIRDTLKALALESVDQQGPGIAADLSILSESQG
ncbi:MAG: glycerol-3-phosphate O-acyltransferase [Paracoccaceae bacterium]|jgi:glycerol-3-phosphate O-acyltransferase